MKRASSGHFTPALFSFLRQLKANNTREWFQAHRDVYERDVEGPLLRFITDLGPRLKAISPAFVVDPKRHGGSMYRIYRDTRFSGDKSPYKTNVAASFRHAEHKTQVSSPGFYLHLEPGDCLGGGGVYHPEMPALTAIRLAIVNDAKRWKAVKTAGFEIEGDSLKRVPAGFDPAHAFVEDLRRKDFYTLERFTQSDVCAPDFIDRYVDACRNVSPLVAFLCRALSLRF